MVKILFLFENEIPTVSITRSFWENLSSEYNISSRFIRLVDVQENDIDWCNILVLIRPNNSFSWRIARNARETGRFVMTMCDDNLLHLPDAHPDLPWQRNGLIKALNHSSAVLSCSKYLIDLMKAYTADHRGIYIDTVVKPEELTERNFDTEESVVKIVYAAGGGQHEKVFERFVLPAMKSIASKKASDFTLTFVSVRPDCEGLENIIPVNYVEGMPLLEYRKYMEDQKFDIGLSPLEADEFTKCKYFNKYLEYTLTGITGVYSNVEPYTYVVKDCFNGVLADNDTASWERKLQQVIEDAGLRRSCARNAQQHVRDSFNEKTVMDHLIADIPELREERSDYRPCAGFSVWKMHYRVLQGIEYLYKMFFYMKREGATSVKQRVTAKIKRLAIPHG